MARADPVELTQQLVGILDDGRRTATYKLAVLLAILDCSVAGTDAHGRASSTIRTRDLARRTVDLYWPQVRPFGDTGRVLAQSSQQRALTVDAVADLRQAGAERRVYTVAGTADVFPDFYERCLDVVELNLVRQPLGKLQRPSGWTERSPTPYPRFLYDDEPFHERVTARQLRAAPLAVHLREGVADVLVSLGGLIRPLLELQWTRDVAAHNRYDLGEDRLREFLFGATRVSLAAVSAPLREAQHALCFYCRQALANTAEVDHFLPWSRIPNDALANLVLAHPGCNNAKRDHLAALEHLERWALRPVDVLGEASAGIGWPLEREKSLRMARGLYAHERHGTLLWQEPGIFQPLDQAQLRDVLALLDA